MNEYDSKNKYIYSLMKDSKFYSIPGSVEIKIDCIQAYCKDYVDMGFYYKLSFLDPFLRYIWKDISFLDYKSLYSSCVVCTSDYFSFSYSPEALNESYIYTANYSDIFDTLCELGHKKTQEFSLLL